MNTPSIADRIHACWLGKAIGGTLGGPHEGRPGPLNLTDYDPVPTGSLPNDDLDLQVVWAAHLLNTGASEVTPERLTEAWRKHVTFAADEYAVLQRNVCYGLTGARLGAFDNWFAEGMGAAIRSEVWACVAPGDPARAAAFAWADAVCDHAGDGVWAEMFFAALESAAFVESDRERLLDTALGFLPETSRVRRAIADTRRWWEQDRDWLPVRNRILEQHGVANFTDVAANLAFTVLGWLAGGGDFGKSICFAVNCGQDTDCTGATLGALLGILEPGSIPPEWKKPIGEKVVLSDPIVNLEPPRTLSEFTEWTLRLNRQLATANPQIGPVVPKLPPAAESSPIRIPATMAWEDDVTILQRLQAPPMSATRTTVELPGHWIVRDKAEFRSPVMLLEFTFHLQVTQPVRVLAFSPTETAVWVDGMKPRHVEIPPTWCPSPVPNFNRGNRGQFETEKLAPGSHALTVAWRAPAEAPATELVIGIGDPQTRHWLPFALAQRMT